MKKFLAALLAVVMVVSLIPATVFAAAASDECAVPEDDHSKANCVLAGVKYVQVGKTVEPKCGQNGYTMYRCECGQYFADDLVPMEPHYTAATKPTTPRVEATCSQYGKAAGFTCDNCGELYYVFEEGDIEATDKDAPAGAIAKLAHDWDSPSYTGADCTASKVVCTVCGAEKEDHEPNEKHNFNYNDPFAITKAPTVCEPGEAVFKCQNSGCEKTKTVVILGTGHVLGHDDMEFVDAQGTCVDGETGTKAHYTCTECDRLFVLNEDGDALIEVTEADLVTEPTHEYDEEPSYRVLPTCTNYGADYYFCIWCGNLEIKNQEAPLGHTTWAEAQAHDADEELVAQDGLWIRLVYEASSCTDKTKYEWDCQKECYCDETDLDDPELAKCSVVLEKEMAAKGHSKKTYTIPATKEVPVTYKLVVCTNANCNAPAKDLADGTEDGKIKWTKSGTTYLLPTFVVVGSNGKDVYEMTEAEKEGWHVIDLSGTPTVKTNVKCNSTYGHFYKRDVSDINKFANCDEPGYEVYFCISCNADVVRTIDACGHNYDLTKGATVLDKNKNPDADNWMCTASSTNYYYIQCGNWHYENDGNGGVVKVRCESTSKKTSGMGHVYNDEPDDVVETPSCEKDAGKYFYCIYCDNEKIVDKVEYKYNPYFNSYEAADAAHGTLLPTGKSVAGDCTKRGHVEYTCSNSDCGLSIWVFDETTGKHLPPQGLEPYEEATCHNGAGMPGFYCQRPGCPDSDGWIPAEGQPLDHILTKIEAVAPNCTEDGNIEYWICSRECCWYDPDLTNEDEEERVPMCYNVEEVENDDFEIELIITRITDDNVVDPATGHDLATHIVARNCVTKGYSHEICENDCGYERVWNVTAAQGHGTGTKRTVAPTCTTDGYELTPCTRTNCTGDDGIAGTDDDKVKTKTIKPATGHKNKAGEIIVDKCNDTVTDRVCVLCSAQDGCYLDCAEEVYLDTETGKYKVFKHHDTYEYTIPATCQTFGYKLRTCANGCEIRDYVIDIEEPVGHLPVWGVRAAGEFVNFNDMNGMGELFLKDAKAFKAAYGEKAIIAYTAPTYETKGSVTFTCADCDAEVTMDVQKVGIDFSMKLDNAVVAGASDILDANGEVSDYYFVDGDVIAVDVLMSAFETDVWGFNFNLSYLAAGMNFLGYKFHADDLFANYMVGNVITPEKEYVDADNDGFEDDLLFYVEEAYGNISVSAYTEAGIGGKLTDAKVTGTKKVITLYFQIEALYDYVEEGVAMSDMLEDAYFVFDDISATNTKGEEVVVNDTDGEYFDIWGLMDTNATAQINGFNMVDVVNCAKIITGESEVEYLSACDVNKDGAVNLVDLDLMNKYMNNKVSAEDIYAALNWAAPEGFVAA